MSGGTAGILVHNPVGRAAVPVVIEYNTPDTLKGELLAVFGLGLSYSGFSNESGMSGSCTQR